MPTIRILESATIEAPAARVYSILANYREGHPRILPSRFFRSLEVEQGGVGEGTVIRFRIRLGGVTRTVRARVTEPEVGRVLAETDLETGAVTTFTVQALGGERCVVDIETTWSASGLNALFARLFAPSILRPIYAQELRNLAAEAQGRNSLESASVR